MQERGAKGIRVANDEGKLCAGVHEVLEIIAAHDMTLASGHISPPEAITLFEQAKTHGVQRMIATHVGCAETLEEQQELLRCLYKVMTEKLTYFLHYQKNGIQVMLGGYVPAEGLKWIWNGKMVHLLSRVYLLNLVGNVRFDRQKLFQCRVEVKKLKQLNLIQ